jgi:hypothetical protein
MLGLRARVELSDDRSLPPDFARVFGDWQTAVDYIVPQNAAIRHLPTLDRLCASRIVVDVPSHTEQTAHIVDCRLTEPMAAVIAGCTPFAFILPTVSFSLLGERVLDLRDA